MNIELIETNLRRAWNDLIEDQPNFGLFGLHTSQQELNIAHHYANYIFPYMKKSSESISCDFDILKSNLHKRPDIIFHERGNNENNLLVVELKLNGGQNESQHELTRIRSAWIGEFGYKFGAYVNIDRSTLQLLEVRITSRDNRDPQE